jgi:WD40 repeat protein
LLGQGGGEDDKAALRAEQKLLLQEALNGMDRVDREVLTLRHREQLSNDETAAVLGVSISQASESYITNGRTLRGHTGAIYHVAFSPDGRRGVTAGSVEASFTVWDVGTSQSLRYQPVPSDVIICVEYSPDGQRLASASNDGTVRLWDAVSGALLRSLSAHASGAWGVAFSPDGRRAVTAGSVEERARQRRLGRGSAPTAAASPRAVMTLLCGSGTRSRARSC